ncbi:hypothetical protein HOLleu_02343 [Holothuria leucospilota]|uniref:CCHC-type domain-containing protein n=1 Tax=Holothuria leucospilota TaxID=206669 RepID=A0A9Q1HGZ9_HOLLE|nr:hypothetical protein HOLleu_02343 [Holothuria leucospilota]
MRTTREGKKYGDGHAFTSYCVPSQFAMSNFQGHNRFNVRGRCGRCLQVGHDKAECPNEVRCNLCGEEGHVSGACPTSYSAHASADVEQAELCFMRTTREGKKYGDGHAFTSYCVPSQFAMSNF